MGDNIYNRRKNQEEEYTKQTMLDKGIGSYKELKEVASDGEVRRDIIESIYKKKSNNKIDRERERP